jgi:NAD(P)-dependent dehydrogenase (short-subunit alcohol dehydrogenase family)
LVADLHLGGRLALVTGAARGIGRGIVEALARDGARVVLADIDESALGQTVSELLAAGLQVYGRVVDVSNSDALGEMFAGVRDQHGDVQILVNNAGRIVMKPFLEQTRDDWSSVIETNLTSVFTACQHAIPGMIASGGGSIVNVSSLAAFHVTVLHAGYAASKAGIVALTRELAYEFGPAGVRVNAIAPGAIATQMNGGAGGKAAADTTTAAAVRARVRLGRWGQPADVGDLVSFLVSERASFISGGTVTIAGGSDLRIF